LVKFGEPFKDFSQFGIDHISIPDTAESFNNIKELGVDAVSKNELAEFKPPSEHLLKKGIPEGRSFRVIPDDKLPSGSEACGQLKQIIVGVAPVARVYAISDLSTLSDDVKKNLSNEVKQDLNFFKYYVVELGLNILVGQEAKIPDVMFEVDLYSDGKDRTDVVTNSIMPLDTLKTMVSVDGNVSIGFDKLLKLVPIVGTALSDIITLDFGKIAFKWELKKYEIATSGPLNYNTFWHVYGTDNVQSFNPLMVLKAKKELTKITANARLTYAIKMKGFLTPIEVYTDVKEIKIVPII
jgi:hypothetical protein